MRIFLAASVVFLLAGCAASPVAEGRDDRSTEIVEMSPEIEQAEEATTEESSYTISEKLAAVDNRWNDRELYEKRFGQVVERCPNNSEESLGDALYKAVQLLDERGITEDTLWSMESVLGAIEPSEADTFDCREVLALAIILRIDEG